MKVKKYRKLNINCVKCKNCIYRKNTRCEYRQMEINPYFIKYWGCDDYKPDYESLLKD